MLLRASNGDTIYSQRDGAHAFACTNSMLFDHCARFRAHIGARLGEHGFIVVAEHANRTVFAQAADGIDHPRRIGAITDQIAEKGKLVGTDGFGVGEAGGECFAVGVDIAQEADTHDCLS